jgi:uncharacterized protein YdhG (YjbR/CyaY superfamily)
MDETTRLDDPTLRLPRPMVAALVEAGATTVGAAWAMRDEDMLALHGVGPKGVRMIRALEAGPSPMDEYLDGLPPEQRAALEHVRAIVAKAAPDADGGTSYGMPAFLLGGRPLLGFRAAKRHLSVFPFSPAAIEAVEDRLEGFDLAKGTIRFTPDRPIPDDVLEDLVRARRREL